LDPGLFDPFGVASKVWGRAPDPQALPTANDIDALRAFSMKRFSLIVTLMRLAAILPATRLAKQTAL